MTATLRRAAASALTAILTIGYVGVQQPLPAAAATTLCATPGKDGSPSVSGIINTYYPGVGSAAAGSTTLTLGTRNAGGASTAFAAGDEALVVQMQGASINATNDANYGANTGTISGMTSLGNSGLYEYVSVTAVAGSTLTIQSTGTGGGLLNSYASSAADGTTTGQKTFQIIRVPQYGAITLGGAITAPAWDGASGGVVAFDASGAVNFNGQTIDVSAKGFRGGAVAPWTGPGASNTDVAQLSTVKANGSKGEGIAGTPNYIFSSGAVTHVASPEGYPNGSMARGAPANAGGGGTDQDQTANTENTGGGGGGNGGAGGVGGKAWNGSGTGLALGGLGGVLLTPSPSLVYMGGGGGSGSNNNATNGPTGSSGGPGGGVVILRVGGATGTGTINSNGSNGVAPQNDGGGGGGAGGTIQITSPQVFSSTITANATGGLGTNAYSGVTGTNNDHGPGGGGGGGIVVTSAPAGVTGVYTGGAAGVTSDGTTYGATAGANGLSQTVLPPQVPGASSGAECGLTGSATFEIGPAGGTNAAAVATGSYDGVVQATNDNDFTAVNIQPKNTSVSTNPDGSGIPLTATITAAQSPCIAHTYENISAGGGKKFSVAATAPSGMLVGLYSDSACTTLATGTVNATVGATSLVSFSTSLGNGALGTIYTQYTTAGPTAFTPYTRYDGVLSFYITANGASADNKTHDELYFGFVRVTKTTAVTSSPCTIATGACPGSVLTYTLSYANVVAGGASEATLSPLPLATATNLTLVDDGTTGSNWFANSKFGLNAAPTDSTAGTTYTYTGTPGVNASKFSALIGGAGFTLVPAGITGASKGTSGTLTFTVTLK